MKNITLVSLFLLLFSLFLPAVGAVPAPPTTISINKVSGEECLNRTTRYLALTACEAVSWSVIGGQITGYPSDKEVDVLWTTTGSKSVNVSGTYTDLNGDPQTAQASRPLTIAPLVQEYLRVVGDTKATSTTGATICQGKTISLLAPAGATNCSWEQWSYVTKASSSRDTITIRPTETATYKLNYASSSPCRSTSIIYTVTVVPAPALPQATAQLVLAQSPATLTVSNPASGYTYNWYNSTKTQVGTGNAYTTAALPLGVTNFYVRANYCYPDINTGTTSDGYTLVTVTAYNVLITTASAPTVPLAAPVALSAGSSLRLRAMIGNGASGTYAWKLNGAYIPGAAQQECSANGPGVYTVLFTPAGASTASISQEVTVTEPLLQQQANGQALSFVNTISVLKPGVKTAMEAKLLAATDRRQQLSYLDGFGRPVQSVAVGASPTQADVVQPVAYDQYGETPKAYLPYTQSNSANPGQFRSGALTEQAQFYQTVSLAARDAQPFASTTVEASPLARPLRQVKPGQAWATHPTILSYSTNAASEVRQWNGLNGSVYYAAGVLTKQTITDEEGRKTEVFQDQLGRLVLKRRLTGSGTTLKKFDTYTVYQDNGAVRYVIPPAAVAALPTTGIITDATFIAQWLYQYTYDTRGRLVERQFPGAAPVAIVYDRFDRAILVQDGNQKAAGNWYFTKYDAQGRAVAEGIWKDSRTRATVQAEADASTLTTEFEERTTTGTYTLTRTYPSVVEGTSGNVLSYTFYDDYDLNADGQPDYAPRTQNLGADEPVYNLRVRGLPTVSRTRVVRGGNTFGPWVTSAVFYDAYGNIAQKQARNHFYASAQPLATTLPDATTIVYRSNGFVPQVLRTVKYQDAEAQGKTTIQNRFAYDHAGRLLSTWQQIAYNGQVDPEVLLARHRYNEVGQVIEKNLHSRDQGVTFLQSEDFRYNLHGQLTHLNNSALTNDGGITNDDTNDVFGLELVRQQANDGGLGNTARWDGGISAVRWQTHNPGQAANNNTPERQRSYRFAYDGLGQLTAATYVAKNTATNTWTLEVGAYDEKNLTYDANGNIKTLQRYSQATATAVIEKLDDLTYTYTGNRLQSVSDLGNAARGFRNLSTVTTAEYDYDANGTVTADRNKGVTLRYNVLSKVDRQTVGASSITYDYDASGTVVHRNLLNKDEYYVDGVAYEQSAELGAGLAWAPTPEGRVLLLPDPNNPNAPERFVYEYHMRDHQGNLRVAFRATSGLAYAQLSSEDPAKEEGDYPKFQNVTSTRVARTTPYGSYVAAVSASQPGPSTRVPVSHGDQLKVRVYYQTPSGVQALAAPSSPAPTAAKLSAALAVAPGLWQRPPVPGENTARRGLAAGVQLSLAGLLSGRQLRRPIAPAQVALAPATTSAEKPAYVAWTLFNDKDQVVSSGQQPAPVVAADLTWRKLEQVLSIDLSQVPSRTGYLQVQLLSDGAQPVYFDSLSIRHPQDGLVISQEQHYYPLGMALSGTAVATLAQPVRSKELFNGGSELQDELLGEEAGIYSTPNRSYDPTIGRLLGVDPLADEYASWSPFSYSFNDPVNFNDPSGAYPNGISPEAYSGGSSFGNDNAGWEREAQRRGGSMRMFMEVAAHNGGWGMRMPGTRLGPSAAQYALANRIQALIQSVQAEANTLLNESADGLVRINATGEYYELKSGLFLIPGTHTAVDINNPFRQWTQDAVLDLLQGGLELAGNAPIIGEPADGVNALIYLARGDRMNAGLSAASMLPVVGNFVSGGKLAGTVAVGSMGVLAAVLHNAKSGGNLLAPLGLGSTGRTTAANLVEQMAMEAAMDNPLIGTQIMQNMGDRRWLGWSKMEYKVKTADGIDAVIHWVGKWDNGVLKAVDDFKFKE